VFNRARRRFPGGSEPARLRDLEPALRVAILDHDEAVRLRKWETLEEDALDDAEDGSVGPDTERENPHRRKGKEGTAPESAEGKGEILPDCVQGVGLPHG
jgi:hypothetical protein